MDQNKLKQEAAQRAAEFVEDGMTIGLGTGSTVVYLVEAIAQRIKDEHLNLTGVATSVRTRKQAESLGIPMKALDEVGQIDLTIDGADEVDKHFQGIKGGGRSHLIEKIVAINSARINEDGSKALTDSKNYIIDLHLGKIEHPHLLAEWLNKQVGIVEHGLFLDLVKTVVVGTTHGPEILDAHRG